MDAGLEMMGRVGDGEFVPNVESNIPTPGTVQPKAYGVLRGVGFGIVTRNRDNLYGLTRDKKPK